MNKAKKNSVPPALAEFAQYKYRHEVIEKLNIHPRTFNRWLDGVIQPSHVKIEGVLKAFKEHKEQIRKELEATSQKSKPKFTFVDLFAGVGGIRRGFESAGGKCVFSSEWNEFARKTYLANFRDLHPLAGDITKVDVASIPEHDVLVGGFPCQPFSKAGVSKKNSLGRKHGFADKTQGTLFFDVARIIHARKPKAFFLENVPNLVGHDGGRTFKIILETLTEDLGYVVNFKVMDGSLYVPQKRRRIIIVGFRKDVGFDFDDIVPPEKAPKLCSILHSKSDACIDEKYCDPKGNVGSQFTITNNLWTYLKAYAEKHRKAGNGFGFGIVGPDDVARTLSARYYKDGSEILVNQGIKNPRMLTPRECARLMGFPDSYQIPVSRAQAYRQFGNSVVVPLAEAVAKRMLPGIVALKAEEKKTLNRRVGRPKKADLSLSCEDIEVQNYIRAKAEAAKKGLTHQVIKATSIKA